MTDVADEELADEDEGVSELLMQALRDVDDIEHLAQLSLWGLQRGESAVSLSKPREPLKDQPFSLGLLSGIHFSEFERLLDPESAEKFAHRQKALGYPYVYRQAVVSLCTLLETTVDDLIVRTIHARPEARKGSVVAGLKGSLAEFMEATRAQQAERILTLLKEALRTDYESGVGRYEKLLEAVGLKAGVDESVRKAIKEAVAVRNAVVHRGGRLDAQFRASCPWYEAGATEVVLNWDVLRAYCTAIQWYLAELYRRATSKTQEQSDLVDALEGLKSVYLKDLKKLRNESA